MDEQKLSNWQKYRATCRKDYINLENPLKPLTPTNNYNSESEEKPSGFDAVDWNNL